MLGHGERLGRLAAALAAEFATSVAIGEHTRDDGHSGGRFTVHRPDGRTFPALDRPDGEFWDLEAC